MLKLKEIQSVEFFITQEGKIAIKQTSFVYGKPVEVYLTLEQYEHLQLMVKDYRSDIKELWNEGVEKND